MIQEASITGLLNTILVIVFIYYAIKFAAKLFGPMLLKYAVRKVEKKVGAQFQADEEVQKNPAKSEQKIKSSSDDLGEYIDYEEID
jgi:hypothetical protein